MSYLKHRGFKFVSASGIVAYYMEHQKFPDRGVCVTIDDGWKDTYTHAFPILKDLHIPATVFLVPFCIGESGIESDRKRRRAPRAHVGG